MRGELLTTSSANVFGKAVVESPESTCPPSPVTLTVQSQLEQALLDLHRLTNIPPTIPILNNQIKKQSSLPTSWGRHSAVFEGSWLGGKKVHSGASVSL